MRIITASDRRSSLLNTVWKRLNSVTSLGPQANAASVNSCCTAATWMAEISVALAQADDTGRACKSDALVRLRAATQAPNFIHFIERPLRLFQRATLASSRHARQAFGNRELSRSLHRVEETPRACGRFESHALFRLPRFCFPGLSRRIRASLGLP